MAHYYEPLINVKIVLSIIAAVLVTSLDLIYTVTFVNNIRKSGKLLHADNDMEIIVRFGLGCTCSSILTVAVYCCAIFIRSHYSVLLFSTRIGMTIIGLSMVLMKVSLYSRARNSEKNSANNSRASILTASSSPSNIESKKTALTRKATRSYEDESGANTLVEISSSSNDILSEQTIGTVSLKSIA
jgi:hypothetical protein